MFRIDNPTAIPNLPLPGPPGEPGFFTNGNPAAALEATIVDDWWCNAIQEEILTVILQAGIDPDKHSTTQLFEALNKLYLGQEDFSAYLTIAAYRAWQAPRRTANSSTAYTATYPIAPGALTDGMVHLLEFHVANGAAATLNVNGLGPKPVHYYSMEAWRPIPPRLFGPSKHHRVAYHGATDAYRLSDWQDTTGDYVPTGRATARIGTILGYGQAVSRTEFAGLFAAYGTAYGAGDGSTTFNLPNLMGVTVAGKSDMSGADRGNLPGGAVLGATLGAALHDHTFEGYTTGGSLALDAYGLSYDYPSALAYVAPGEHPVGANTHYHANVQVNGGTHHAGGPGNAWGYLSVGGYTHANYNVQPTIVANYAICL
jgi:microcystin-dependent protein